MAQMRAPLVSMFVLLAVTSSQVVAESPALRQESAPVTIRGRIVSLDPQQGKPFAFKAENGRLYRFLADDVMTDIFADERVRDRHLQITGQLHKEDRLELTKVQSLRGGKLYDLYYFCDVCNITTYAPGPCPCCRKELEFRETPASEP
jgi:hypothetical protein